MTALGMGGAISDLLRYRGLLHSLTLRDLRVRYKQSWLGVGWAVVLPLSMMLVFSFVFTRAIDASSVLGLDIPYALYAYVGLVPWTFFAVSLGGSVNAMVANRNLVTKVYFPREVFPLSCMMSAFVDFCIAGLVFIGLAAYFHLSGVYRFTLDTSMLFLPVVVVVQMMLTAGLGMILAMGNLFYRDVRQLFGAVIQLWMFVSCVVVPIPRDGSNLAMILSLNPMVAIIGAYRDCAIYGRLPEGGAFAYATVVAVVVLIGGWIIFRRSAHRFAECI